MRPVTSMLPMNTMPSRSFIVSDPSKLTYFARANAVRAGTANTWGALSGLGDPMPASPESGAGSTKTAGGLQTVADFFMKLGQGLLGGGNAPTQTVVVREDPSPMPYVIGLAAVGLAGFAVYKVMKR